MYLTVLGSSSNGNCYLIYNADEVLIIEAGINFNKVKEALDFNISNVKGCLITHEHKDHSAFALQLASSGISIYSSALTFKAMNLTHHNFIPCEHNKSFCIGNFSIIPLRVEHDALEPFCYIIQHPEMGNLLFMTDTFCSRYSFDNFIFHHILIEANYSHEILYLNKASGTPQTLHNRILFSHMELGTTLSLLQSYAGKSTRNIVLLHLSDSNSNSAQFKAATEAVCSYPSKIFIASPNLSIPLNKSPF